MPIKQESRFWRILWPALAGTLLFYLPALIVVIVIGYVATGSQHFTGSIFPLAGVIAFLGGLMVARADDRWRRR